MRIQNLLLLVLTFLLFSVFPGNGWATTYYVKNGGNDGADGLSDANAWATISKVNGSSFSPGDSILFKRGNTWAGTALLPPSSGSSGNPITFGAYGSGARPIIATRGSLSGWNTSGNWTNLGGNVWQMSTGDPKRLWINGAEGTRHNSTPNATQNWYAGGGVLQVYSPGGNPASAFSSMQRNNVEYTVYLSNKNYITFNELNLQGGYTYLASLEGANYITFEYCDLGMYTAQRGVNSRYSDYGIVRYCTIDSGDRTINLFENNYPENGIMLQWGSDYWEIHHNTILDWGHVGVDLFADPAEGNTPITNVLIHHNDISCTHVDSGMALGMDAGPGLSSGNKIYNNYLHHCPEGLQLNMDGLEVYYNIIAWNLSAPYEPHTAVGISIAAYNPSCAKNMKFYNNLIENNECEAIRMTYANSPCGGITGNIFRNNILFNNHLPSCDWPPGDYELFINTTGNIYGNTFENNIIYESGVTNTVFYGSQGAMSVSIFNNSDANGDVVSGNISPNPLFVDPANGNFHLQAGSPAINAGLNVGLTSDREGNAIVGLPDIGAYEYATISPPPPDTSSKTPSPPSAITISP